MATNLDVWYVRLPSGRVVRARSTEAVRYHIRTGRIPAEARVRRTAADEWMLLEWTAEFADLVQALGQASVTPAGEPSPPLANGQPAPRSSQQDLREPGMRGLVGELLTALDSALSRHKLILAGATGLLLGVGAALYLAFFSEAPAALALLGAGSIAFLALLAWSLAATVVTQMTKIELARLRPPRPREVRAGLLRHASNLLLAHLAVLGPWLALMYGLHQLPGWLLEGERTMLIEAVAVPLLTLRVLVEVVAWPFVGLALLLGPVVVIEEHGLGRALAEWCTILRRHLGRVLLYEALAATVGLVLTMPFAGPVLLSWSLHAGDPGVFGAVSRCALLSLGGLACAPLLAYLWVANVFIYLNVKYEFFHAAR